jgi:uncharacterized membrane protein YfcA
VQGLSGFAFGLVAMSFWAWSINPELVVPMAVFGALTGQLLVALTVRRKFYFKALLPFLLGGLIGVPLGIVCLPLLDINRFKMLLGGLLVLWCPLMLITNRLPHIKIGGRIADGVIGALGGMMTGLGGIAGVIPTLWCILRGFDKEMQRAVIQNFNLIMLLVTMSIYIRTGIVTLKFIPIFMLIAISLLIPVYIGHRLYRYISEPLFRKVILTLLSLSGLTLLCSSLPLLMRGA